MRPAFFICQVIDYRPGGAQSAAWRPLTIVRSGRPHGGLLYLGFGRPHGGLPQMGNRLSFGNR
jgi:hypothetical protein